MATTVTLQDVMNAKDSEDKDKLMTEIMKQLGMICDNCIFRKDRGLSNYCGFHKDYVESDDWCSQYVNPADRQ